ncbi:adenosine kinase [Blastocladiella emersonii ATCC 22665]|nr:adenosine kinase [Blastocladiella emersonii ATCC 22665]
MSSSAPAPHQCKPKLLGMGNPLLDISAEVEMPLLAKYKLEANHAILADASHMPLYQELIANHKVTYVAGGATQNSIRGAQWLLPAGSTAYMGCVGTDHFAGKLEDAARADGVDVHYMKTDEVATGTCAVLITEQGANRSLVANLSAAEKYKVEHLQRAENWALVESADYYYIGGFFLTVSPAAIMAVARHAAQHNKVFTMNLSAPFLCQFFKEPMDAATGYWDYLFGNETEAVAYAESHGWAERDVKEIAKKIVALPKVNTKRPRVVVFTQGADDVIVASVRDGQVFAEDHPIIPVAKDAIVDTNGAGDAFVGGFLAQLVLGKDIETCVKAGTWAAHVVIQQSGPVYPKDIAVPADFSKLNIADI